MCTVTPVQYVILLQKSLLDKLMKKALETTTPWLNDLFSFPGESFSGGSRNQIIDKFIFFENFS